MTTIVNVISALTVLALTVVTVAGTVRALAPRPPPIACTVDADWAVAALRQQIALHPSRSFGEVSTGGVVVTARRVVIVGMDGDRAWPMWRTRVGAHEQDVPDIETVTLVVLGRLRAIAAWRAEQAGGEA